MRVNLVEKNVLCSSSGLWRTPVRKPSTSVGLRRRSFLSRCVGMHGLEDDLPEPLVLDADIEEVDNRTMRDLQSAALPAGLEESLSRLQSDEYLSAALPEDLLECYLSVKRKELGTLRGSGDDDVCRRYREVY